MTKMGQKRTVFPGLRRWGVFRTSKQRRKTHRAFLGIKPLLSLPELKKRLWAVFSLWVRLRGKKRNNGLCEVCNKNPIHVAYHILPVGNYPGVRFDPENVVAACVSCNFGEFMNRIPTSEYWKSRIGPEKYAMLQEIGKNRKYTREELTHLIEHYKSLLAGTTRWEGM